jgi:hypothetical protein
MDIEERLLFPFQDTVTSCAWNKRDTIPQNIESSGRELISVLVNVKED